MTPSISRPAIASVVFFALGSCADGGPSNHLDVEDLPALTLEEELRIGSIDDPSYGFSRLRGPIHVTAEDSIFVVEHAVPEIRVYGPDGDLARRVGRPGDGPGELRSVLNWGILGDTIWTIGLGRATLFSRSGEVLESAQLSPLRFDFGDGFTVNVAARELLPDGTLLGRWSSYRAPQPGGPDVDTHLPVVRFGWDGEVIDTIGYQSFSVRPSEIDFVRVGEVDLNRQIAPSSRPLVEPFEGDTIRVDRRAIEGEDPGLITIRRVNAEGDTVWTQTLSTDPIPVSQTYRDSLLDVRAETWVRAAGSFQASRARMVELHDFDPFFPGVESLEVLNDGSSWMRLHGTGSSVWEWAVFDQNGEPVGRVSTPPNATPVWSSAGSVYWIETDDLDIPWLVRYRIGS